MPDPSFDLSFHANGKLLLSGEYFVLDGAKALALPTIRGQWLHVNFSNTATIHWTALDYNQTVWLEAKLQLSDLRLLSASDHAGGQRLQQILQQAQKQNPHFLKNINGCQVQTQLEFPRKWGLGSSSTILSCMARWADIDAYELLEQTMGGSGYDLACAENDQPIVYWREDKRAHHRPSPFSPPFASQLYFVYLGKKQNSREGIKRYRERSGKLAAQIERISQLSLNMEQCESLTAFEAMLLEHEWLVAKTLDLPRAQDLYFSTYPGVIKSLGAWGGDFVLATSRAGDGPTKKWFNELGYSVVFKYDELIR
ncbi:MAG: GYDIA family GHMP kinase [Bacteroidota bacterium]